MNGQAALVRTRSSEDWKKVLPHSNTWYSDAITHNAPNNYNHGPAFQHFVFCHYVSPAEVPSSELVEPSIVSEFTVGDLKKVFVHQHPKDLVVFLCLDDLAAHRLVGGEIVTIDKIVEKKSDRWLLNGFTSSRTSRASRQAFRELRNDYDENVVGVKAVSQVRAAAVSIPKEFLPSDELMNLVDRGMRQFLGENPKLQSSALLTEFLSQQNLYARKQIFSSRLRALISTLAFRQFDGLEPKTAMTTGNEFSGSFQLAFGEVFPFWPNDLPSFQRLLKNDLLEYLSAGGSYSGHWGGLAQTNGEIRLMLSENSAVRLDGNWKQAPRADL